MHDEPRTVADRLASISRDLHSEPEEQLTLDRIVRLAVAAIPGADMCGVSLRRDKGKVETPASTSPVVDQADALQYDVGEGPCLDAIWVDDTYVVEDMTQEGRWPRWAPHAAELGVRSVLSVRLATTSDTFGGLNLYARVPHAFNPHDVDVAHMYADQATEVLHATRQVTGLRTALQSRHLIGVAQGILMQRYELSLERSFEALRRYSQQSNVKLRDVARQVIDLRELPSREESLRK
jgi:GAF domain-containing protein